MSSKKKQEQKNKDEEVKDEDFELSEEKNELGIPEGEEYDELVLDRDEAEEFLEKISKLKKKLVAAEKEKTEYLDGWQRARSEYAKLKSEQEQNKDDAKVKAKKGVLLDFMPIADSFDMAFSNQEAWEKVDENWRKGVEYIHAQLISAFEREGMTEINPEPSTAFDPLKHEPLETISVESEKDDDAVIEVVQKGYLMGQDVVRPAKVKVGKYQK